MTKGGCFNYHVLEKKKNLEALRSSSCGGEKVRKVISFSRAAGGLEVSTLPRSFFEKNLFCSACLIISWTTSKNRFHTVNDTNRHITQALKTSLEVF